MVPHYAIPTALAWAWPVRALREGTAGALGQYYGHGIRAQGGTRGNIAWCNPCTGAADQPGSAFLVAGAAGTGNYRSTGTATGGTSQKQVLAIIATGRCPTSGAGPCLGSPYDQRGRVGCNTGHNTGTNTNGERGNDTGGTSKQSKDVVLLAPLVAAPRHCNHTLSLRSSSGNNIPSTPGSTEAAHLDPAHTYGTNSKAFTSSD